jgi:zinc/manganese transport system substrate-binding protein
MRTILFLILATFLAAATSFAKVKVVASLSDLADLTKVIGGDRVDVDYIVRGSQNPHFIEVKPSFMMKLKSADLFVTIGMGLEIWAPQIIDGSRNPNLTVLDCSKNIHKLEIPATKVDASYGDVHPFGNPHYWLDPENAKVILDAIYDSLSKIAPADRDYFKSNMDNYVKKLDAKIAEWTALMRPLKGMKLVSYHTSFSYFANRFGLSIVGYVEPKPGIPPTPSHSTELIQMMRSSEVKAIGLEQYYEDSTPEQIAQTTGAKLVRLCTSVGGLEGTGDYLNLIDYDVRALVAAYKGS